jgi:hypothetical protein
MKIRDIIIILNIPVLLILSSIEESNLQSCLLTYKYQVFVCDFSLTFILFIISMAIFVFGFIDLLFCRWDETQTHGLAKNQQVFKEQNINKEVKNGIQR